LEDEGFEVEATPGRSGQFDVLRDGELVFSKHEVKRFPEPGEVLSLLQR
jgi:selT/selW/selH-like putative selenoprotein